MFACEKLEVYRKAYQINHKVYQLLKRNNKIPIYARNQFGRACLSVILNIAEGSAKFSKKDRRNYYIIARGSTFECASLVKFLHDAEEIGREEMGNLYASFEEISIILYHMIKNLER